MPKNTKLQKSEKTKKPVKTQVEETEEDFDFGGIPGNVSFGRNIGCGG